MFTEAEARAEVVAAGIRLVESGLIARTWGNVSARISDTEFLITPTGRDYLTLQPEEIVPVSIADLSHRGEIKPSAEKGVHAAIYGARPGVQFIVHTHQDFASAISAAQVPGIAAGPGYPLLGGRVLTAKYAMPSTKPLAKSVAQALAKSAGHAIILRNHGAVCFAATPEEAFQAAADLESACEDAIRAAYCSSARQAEYDGDHMRELALFRIAGGRVVSAGTPLRLRSERGADGIELPAGEDRTAAAVRAEAALHEAIYAKRPDVHSIVPAVGQDMLTLARGLLAVKPMLDDFAQIVGPAMRIAHGSPEDIADALGSTAAVTVEGRGALCCGPNHADAEAVRMIVEKNARAYLWSALLGPVKPIRWVDTQLMRAVYLRKYSRQISQNV